MKEKQSIKHSLHVCYISCNKRKIIYTYICLYVNVHFSKKKNCHEEKSETNNNGMGPEIGWRDRDGGR